jgi:hypothetical protein
LAPDLIFNGLRQIAFLKGIELSVSLVGDGVGVVAGHFRKPLALARARHQVFGLLLRGCFSRCILVFRRDQNLAQE